MKTIISLFFLLFSNFVLAQYVCPVYTCETTHDGIKYYLEVIETERTRNVSDSQIGFYDVEISAGSRLIYKDQDIIFRYSNLEYFSSKTNIFSLQEEPNQSSNTKSYLSLEGYFKRLPMSCEETVCEWPSMGGSN